MIIDQQQGFTALDIFVLPDWVYGNAPEQPSDIKDYEYVVANVGGRVIRVTGTTDKDNR